MSSSTLAVIPGGFVRFVFAKLVVVAVAVAVGTYAVRTGRLPRHVVVIVSVGLAVLAIAAMTAVGPLGALVGRWPRYEGVFVLAVYVGAAWLGARVMGGTESQDRVAHLHRSTAVVAIVLAVFSGLDLAGASPLAPSDAERTGALLGNATDQGIIGLMALALLLPTVQKRETVLLVGAAGAALVVALSGSRAVIAASVVVLAVHLVRRGALRPVLLAAASIAVAVLAFPQTRERLLGFHTIRGRSILWRETLDLSGDHPVLGVGPSGYVDAIGRYHDEQWVDQVGVVNPPDSPHNWILQALSAGGVPLALIAVTLAVAVLWAAWQVARNTRTPFAVGALAALIGYGLVLMTHFTSAGTTCWAAFLAGAAVARPVTSAREWRPGRLVVVAAAVVGIVVMAAGAIAEVQVQRGSEAAAAGKTAQADEHFMAAHRWRPWDSDIAMIAAAVLAEPATGGDGLAQRRAAAWGQTAIGVTPDSYQAGLALAVVDNAREQFAQALKRLDTLVEMHPAEPQARIQRALARYATGDLGGAQRDLRRAHELDRNDPTAPRLMREITRRQVERR